MSVMATIIAPEALTIGLSLMVFLPYDEGF